MTITRKPYRARKSTPARPRKEPALIDGSLARKVRTIEETAARYLTQLAKEKPHSLPHAALTGSAIKELKEMINEPVLAVLQALANTESGFMTDRPRQGYDPDTIRTCAVEALLRKVSWAGNEFNVLSGKLYVTQNGYRRKVAETDGLTDLQVVYALPRYVGAKVLVRIAVGWKLNGKQDQLRDSEGKPGRIFSFGIAAQQASDEAIVGRAIRKALRAVHIHLHGPEFGDDVFDDDQDDYPQAPSPQKQEGATSHALSEIDHHLLRAGIHGDHAAELKARYAPGGFLTESAGQALLRELGRMVDAGER